MEATGSTYEALAENLHQRGYRVCAMNLPDRQLRRASYSG